MSTGGILAVELAKDSVNWEKFFDTVHGSLNLPFDGCNLRSIAIQPLHPPGGSN